MKNKKSTLHECAMRGGTIMGIFWIFKFILFFLGLQVPFLGFLFIGLTIAVPFVAYRLVNSYRKNFCENNIPFSHAFLFTNSVFFYASLLSAVAHYIYFRYMDNGFLIEQYTTSLDTLKTTMVDPEVQQSILRMEEAFQQLSALTPIEMTFQLISQNIFFGLLTALILALIVMRKNKI
ncbi:MAG: DUF4199 domain-containing protein [Phocaeicola sp.]